MVFNCYPYIPPYCHSKVHSFSLPFHTKCFISLMSAWIGIGIVMLVIGLLLLRLPRWTSPTRTVMMMQAGPMVLSDSPMPKNLLLMQKLSERRKLQQAIRASALKAADLVAKAEAECLASGALPSSPPPRMKPTTSRSKRLITSSMMEEDLPVGMRRSARTGTLLSTGWLSAAEFLETQSSSGKDAI